MPCEEASLGEMAANTVTEAHASRRGEVQILSLA